MNVEATALEDIRRYLTVGTPHHALLFCGLDIETRAKWTRTLSQSFFNAASGSARATRIEKESFPDLIQIKATEESFIRVDTIRELTADMEIAPLEGTRKLAVIEEAEKLNAAATNAFLKTLEEPLPGRYFWLFADRASALIPTLVSRCLVFQVPPSQQAADKNEPLFSQWWNEASEGSPSRELRDAWSEKPLALGFCVWIQSQLRNLVLQHSASTESTHLLLRQCEEALSLEHRLQTNASSSLLLEDFFLTLRLLQRQAL